jgi:glycerophosphoryl diester phosphodiesterase
MNRCTGFAHALGALLLFACRGGPIMQADANDVATSVVALPDEAKPARAAVPLNIGHRGASGHAPEHTIISYDMALQMGADYIEQDLQLTKDGVLIVLHDSDLDRTARGSAENCTGDVIEKTLAQIKTCDVGLWFNQAFPALARPEYVGQRIPTLEEVFQRYRHLTNYHIETKTPEDAPGMEQKLLQLLDKYNLKVPAEKTYEVLIQSFSPASLQLIHQLNPNLPLIQLYGGGTSASIQATLDAVDDYAVGIGPSFRSIDSTLVADVHARCMYLHPYTVNNANDMRRLLDLGVDGMFTNFPDRLNVELGKRAVAGKHAAKIAADARKACLETAGN